MDVHFNAYKVKYDILDEHLKKIQRAQYVRSMDIFISLDDVIHNMHRPLVNKETQLCGINAVKQCVTNIINLVAHYKMWATKRRIQCRIFGIFTTTLHHFKNAIYLPNYRDYFAVISDRNSAQFFFVNDATLNALPIIKNIGDYVEDVFFVDSRYLEPSIIPLFLRQAGVANYEWAMVISRDHYDLQYAYRDKWIFVSPKGDNTRIVDRAHLWTYLAVREHIKEIPEKAAFFHHNLFPMALALTGNKYRTIPRLQRIGWATVFSYLNTITDQETESLQILTRRLMEILEKKGVEPALLNRNLACINIEEQVSVMNDIDRASIMDQLKYVSDHDALTTMNELYFSEFPINIPFLTASYKPQRVFT